MGREYNLFRLNCMTLGNFLIFRVSRIFPLTRVYTSNFAPKVKYFGNLSSVKKKYMPMFSYNELCEFQLAIFGNKFQAQLSPFTAKLQGNLIVSINFLN